MIKPALKMQTVSADILMVLFLFLLCIVSVLILNFVAING